MSRNLGDRNCPVCRLHIGLDIIEELGARLTRRSDRYHMDGRSGYEFQCPGPQSRKMDGRMVVTSLEWTCQTPLSMWLETWPGSGYEPTWELAWSRSWNDEPRCYGCMDAPDYCEKCLPGGAA